MTPLDPAVEIPKLTDKDRIRYRFRHAPESVASGLFLEEDGHLSTMTGTTVRVERGRAAHLWLGEDPYYILEAVIRPVLDPYRGMLLEDVDTKELWVYEPSQEDLEWASTENDAKSEADIAKRFAAGELTIFTPEVPSV